MLVDISDKVGTGEVATESLNGQCYPEGRKQPIFSGAGVRLQHCPCPTSIPLKEVHT